MSTSIPDPRVVPSQTSSPQLDPFAHAGLSALAAQIEADPAGNPEQFCALASSRARSLPSDVQAQLAWYRRHGSPTGVIRIAGVPVDDDLPSTPVARGAHVGAATRTAKVQGLVNQSLGETVGYAAVGDGTLFEDVVPLPGERTVQTAGASAVERALHTDLAGSDLRPDWLSIVCLRDAPDAALHVVPARDIARVLTAAERRLLRQPLWTTRPVADGDVEDPTLRPILGGAEDDPTIRFDAVRDRGITHQAQAMLKRIAALGDIYGRQIVPRVGDLLLIDNRRVLTGHSPFAARFDGGDRFLLRSRVVADLDRSRAARPADGRVIS